MRAQLHKTSIPNPRHAKDHGLINHLTHKYTQKKHFFPSQKMHIPRSFRTGRDGRHERGDLQDTRISYCILYEPISQVPAGIMHACMTYRQEDKVQSSSSPPYALLPLPTNSEKIWEMQEDHVRPPAWLAQHILAYVLPDQTVRRGVSPSKCDTDIGARKGAVPAAWSTARYDEPLSMAGGHAE